MSFAARTQPQLGSPLLSQMVPNGKDDPESWKTTDNPVSDENADYGVLHEIEECCTKWSSNRLLAALALGRLLSCNRRTSPSLPSTDTHPVEIFLTEPDISLVFWLLLVTAASCLRFSLLESPPESAETAAVISCVSANLSFLTRVPERVVGRISCQSCKSTRRGGGELDG